MTSTTDHILKLAEIIREVDGGNRLGAAALAEAILSHPGSRWSPAVEAAPSLLTRVTRALAGDKEAARQFLYEAGFTDKEGNLRPPYCSEKL